MLNFVGYLRGLRIYFELYAIIQCLLRRQMNSVSPDIF